MNFFKVYEYKNGDYETTIFEVWGGSTKHPDVRRNLKSDIEKKRFLQSQYIDSHDYAVFQWVCQCISELSFGSYYLMKKWLEQNAEKFEKCKIY